MTGRASALAIMLLLTSALAGCLGGEPAQEPQVPGPQEPVYRIVEESLDFGGTLSRHIQGVAVDEAQDSFVADFPTQGNFTRFEVVFDVLGSPTYRIDIETANETLSFPVDGELPFREATSSPGPFQVSIHGNAFDTGTSWRARVTQVTRVLDPNATAEPSNETAAPFKRVGETKEDSKSVAPGVGRPAEAGSEIEITFEEEAADESVLVVRFAEPPATSFRIDIFVPQYLGPVFTKLESTDQEFVAFLGGSAGPYRAVVYPNGPHAAFDWTFRVTENQFVPIEQPPQPSPT